MALTTMEQAWGLIGQWWMFSMLVYMGMTFLCWNYKWYRHLREHTPLPEMRALFMAKAVMVAANSWSVWRLWRCENWDTDLAPLLIYILMIIALHGYVPALMAIKSLWLCVALSLVACGLAIAYTTLAFIEADTYAGIIGVFNIVWALFNLGYTLYLNPLREEEILNVYYGRVSAPKNSDDESMSASIISDSDEDDSAPLPPLVEAGAIPIRQGGGVRATMRMGL